MDTQHSARENILDIHSQAAESTRKIARYLIDRIEENISDEPKFYRMLQQSDRASLTLQRLSSILGNLIPIEQSLLDKKLDLLTNIKGSKELQKSDFELIIYFVKDLGLIKDGAENDIDKIYNQYLGNSEEEKISHVN